MCLLLCIVSFMQHLDIPNFFRMYIIQQKLLTAYIQRHNIQHIVYIQLTYYATCRCRIICIINYKYYSTHIVLHVDVAYIYSTQHTQSFWCRVNQPPQMLRKIITLFWVTNVLCEISQQCKIYTTSKLDKIMIMLCQF